MDFSSCRIDIFVGDSLAALFFVYILEPAMKRTKIPCGCSAEEIDQKEKN